ncbi:hypothetical protein HAX54_010156 [Datura stramonium]|uniref:Pectinesterase inhibitor domain-containing protein n=1 Tax=Datura stramonium TaxID=4076 RepID=A0ABS8WYC4_DATST|nr:hypothetical protein [Datura stramonium]
MASGFSVAILLILFFSLSHAKHHHHLPPEIRGACKASRDPSTCEASFHHHFPSNLTALQIIYSALGRSSHKLTKAQAAVKDILKSSAGNINVTVAARNCVEGLDYSEYRFKQTVNDALARGEMKDARAWMSAALGYQHGCSSGLKKVNDTSRVRQTIVLMESLIGFTSDTLGMIMNYDIHGNQIASWSPPKTEREGFWEAVRGTREVKGGVPWSLKPNVTVCKVGNCGYRRVQDAVNAAPNNLVSQRFVIWIKAGMYDEIVRVPMAKTNLVFLGDGMGKTVITGSLNVGGMANSGVTTFESATVGVVGDGFMARDVTIQNTAGADAQQAVAFRSSSDHSIIENCEFLGNQDTLYVNSLRQYYKSCRIQGNIDFIFGNAAALFQDCDILVAPRIVNPENGETNVVTAHGRIEPGQSTGFIFHNCSINGTAQYMKSYYSNPSVHKTFLGRPWKEYARTVFLQCRFGDLINPAGWMPWSGEFALNTLYYGEFGNTGAAANAKERVLWSSQIPPQHVYTYSLQNFIQGDQWIPLSS